MDRKTLFLVHTRCRPLVFNFEIMTFQPSDSELIVETAAEPLQQILKKAAGVQRSTATLVEEPKAPTPQAAPFHPVDRQPLALLTILDDGRSETGEVVRIRQSGFSIGREQGDLRIPFDQDMSAKHLELRCQQQNGIYRWYLIDLNSTNGTFLRGFRASLSRDTELLLGSRRYLFQLPVMPDLSEVEEIRGTKAYQAPTPGQLQQMHPRLTEVGVNHLPQTFTFNSHDVVIGRSQNCNISIEDDPCLNPRHARFYKDDNDRWMISDMKSDNGVWIRIRKMPLDQHAQFQIGQQRFLFQPKIV